MGKPEKKRRRLSKPFVTGLAAALAVVAVTAAAAAAAVLLYPRSDPASALESGLELRLSRWEEGLSNSEPARAIADSVTFEPAGELKQQYRRARESVAVSYLKPELLTADLHGDMQKILDGYIDEARLPSEIYTENLEFRSDVLERAYVQALRGRLEHSADYTETKNLDISLRYSKDRWEINENAQLSEILSGCTVDMPGFEEACGKLEYIRFRYRLRDWTSPGPVPNESCYGETEDAAVISRLLETESAKFLMQGQTMDWSADKELLPGSSIYYYFDDTILSIVWQESEHGAVGTFAETFIAEASQLRRKLADDSFGVQSYYYPTELARHANAVLAVSGDFYDLPGRVYGIYAYDGQLRRSCLTDGESCCFTDSGDMLFTYAGQFADEAEAQSFLDENKVMFSLSFGPVLIDKGRDVTPDFYPLGEILDTYARCAVGQLGKLHYLTMTINCQQPDNYYLVTLRQAADSMIEHGCINAYTLDGGQTGSIMIGGRLINPVQFGVERRMSDIFYFATAIPNAA